MNRKGAGDKLALGYLREKYLQDQLRERQDRTRQEDHETIFLAAFKSWRADGPAWEDHKPGEGPDVWEAESNLLQTRLGL